MRPIPVRSAPIALLALAAVLVSGPLSELEAQRFGYQSRRSTVRLGDGLPDIRTGFTFCRLAYRSVVSDGSGSGWTTDFPEAEMNLLTRLPDLTTTRISTWSHGEPGYAVVQATDEDLFECPFLMATDVGELGFAPPEVEAMREYLLKGGFFWVDDFWGPYAWRQFATQIGRVLPDHEIVDLPLDHPIFSALYALPEGVPQMPSYNFWNGPGSPPTEFGVPAGSQSMRAILDDNGRIMVLMTHNTDISDGWEREAYDDRYFLEFSGRAYGIAMNVLVWVLSH